LWAVVQERDGLGDQLVPDYLIRVEEGGSYTRFIGNSSIR
jgi:glucose/arabinose dehydrogenase